MYHSIVRINLYYSDQLTTLIYMPATFSFYNNHIMHLDHENWYWFEILFIYIISLVCKFSLNQCFENMHIHHPTY